MKLPQWTKSYLWAASFWFVACFLLFVIADKLVMPIIAGQWTSTVEVPLVEGLSRQAAESKITDLDLKVVWREEGKYSSTIPENKVLNQIPRSGREVKVGRTVRLTPSLGKRKVALPELRGESQKQGKITLKRLGVVQGSNIKGFHANIPRGVIIRTEPQEGSMVRMGDTVSLVISSGRQAGMTLLSQLTGISLEEAKTKIESSGLKLGKLTQSKSEEHIAQTVIGQYPLPGEYLSPGTEVDLTITE